MKKIFKLISVFIKVRFFDKWDSREKIEKYQNKMLKRQMEFFRNNSPYFKAGKFKENASMNKEFMMENFDELNTVGIKKAEAFKIAIEAEQNRDFKDKYKNISVGLSSGTSGHRGLFITTEEEQAIWAGTILAKMLPKGFQKHRLAFFLRANNNLYSSVNSSFIKLEYFDTFLNPSGHIEKLNNYAPTILIAPSSILIILGKFKEEGLLNINPKKIISVAEILEDRDKEYIKKCFSVNVVHQVYQATEGFLAYTCEYGNLHLNEDIIKFEKDYIDERRFYPIITDFKRSSQPFVKYHLNDILVETNESCSCGSKLQRIEKIEGRSDDIFKFYNDKGEIINIFPDFIRRCMLFIEGIREYQVFQTDYNKIEVAVLDIEQLQKEKIKKEFKKLFKNFRIKNVEINFISYNIDSKVKLKRIINKSNLRKRDEEV
ncbi:MAG: CoF synthetase [Fusobacterium sp.]|uniref:F390 synthetase-related protein n=1 Tax=Fusobacterium sp. TaxID=68766 RepID=UPI0026DC3423|nr:F390 synthetase-related protein [Fusobacterium sp.]MDO4689757.1 CoF synthetase [Fusobacterium sp.]